jgi:uncharacterized protein YjeT (DUF2065 family)
MNDFLTALALVFVIEGLLLALMPDRLRWIVARMSEMPVELLRAAGLVAALGGVFFVWLLRG